MAKAYVSEYGGMAWGSSGGPQVIDEASLKAEYTVDFTAGEAHSANFQPGTAIIRVELDGVASIKFGLNAVATTSNKRKSSSVPEYFGLGAGTGQGWRFSAIANT
jgi:hypothetical protein